MRFHILSVALIATTLSAVALTPSIATAQTVQQAGAPARMNCATNTSAPNAFGNCALAFYHQKLVRAGTVVAKENFIFPIGLTAFVAGDSAIRYARSYEHQTRWALNLELLGTMLTVSPIVARAFHHCNGPFCRPTAGLGRVNIAQAAGVSLLGIAIPLHIHARDQGNKAVSLYNGNLGR